MLSVLLHCNINLDFFKVDKFNIQEALFYTIMFKDIGNNLGHVCKFK